MKLSIITTLYKSAHFVENFLNKAIKAGEDFGGEFEIIIVDDGSPDHSLQLAKAYANTDHRIVVIELARNFGHHQAFLCGMHYASGELCFLIDSDLEVDPEVLHKFHQTMESSNADVVYGVQAVRKGSAKTRLLGGIFWRIFSAFSEVDVPSDIMTERLMRRRYLEALLSMGDKNLFLGGMFYWPGFYQVPLSIIKKPRIGASSYSLLRRLGLLVEAISSFSSAPLAIIFWMGLGISSICALYFTYLLLRRLLFPDSLIDGFAFLALASVGSSGLVLLSLGVVGLYIHRIFKQVQNRPLFVVKEIHTKH
ncbi:MAG: glycosyltransferase family 2 protein [Pseudomonadales bacterium]|jgi:putative glycosyltransferase